MNSKKLISVILLLLLLFAIPIQVSAMGAATAEIPFTVKNAPGTVVIEAVESAPLPGQTVFEGVSSGKFEISFAEPGDYYYKIYQKPGTGSDITYDSTVYTVCISVFVHEDGNLYSVVAVNIESSSQKAEDIAFENTLVESGVPSEPSAPGEPSESTTTDSSNMPDFSDTPPQTGDNSHLSLWIVLMAASFFGMTKFFFMWKKSE